MNQEIEIYEVIYPFRLDKTKDIDCGFSQWVPGCARESYGDYEDSYYYANGEGKMVITVISRHKPSIKHQERVFYFRSWIAPDGQRFGRNTMRVTAVSNFNKLIKGFRYKYEIES